MRSFKEVLSSLESEGSSSSGGSFVLELEHLIDLDFPSVTAPERATDAVTAERATDAVTAPERATDAITAEGSSRQAVLAPTTENAFHPARSYTALDNASDVTEKELSDCPPTVLDSSSEPEVAVTSCAADGDESPPVISFWQPGLPSSSQALSAGTERSNDQVVYGDILLDALNDGWFTADSERSPEEWDSEDTAAYDPNFPPSPVELGAETTDVPMGPDFWDSVEQVIAESINAHWLTVSPCLQCITDDVENNKRLVINAIVTAVSSASRFKIGITGDPRWRFHHCNHGAYAKEFARMTLLYASPWSNQHIALSTGAMERAAIAHFHAIFDERCLNIAKGGEGASKVSPHFLYVVSDA